MCCRLREEVAAARQAGRLQAKALEDTLQEVRLQVITLEAKLEAAEERVAVRDAEVQKLMDVSAAMDNTAARAVYKMEAQIKQLRTVTCEQDTAVTEVKVRAAVAMQGDIVSCKVKGI